ncbi:MAG: sigma-70 family RNA polymerase sigma factor [Oscillospiraceae bacterium]|nr:sigma-70 family RNA polymerase sigma factor [Oscillospiraceae bacterium]
MSDRDIIGLFFARDERAITEFDRAYGALCYRIALDVTGDPGAAEECLNDTRLRLWNAIPPANPDSLRAYAARIARNLALNRLEREKTGKRNAVLLELDAVTDEIRDSFEEDLLESDALAKRIDRFLAGRKKIEAVVFVRRYFAGESGREISRATGLSAVAVSRMLKRLRRDLREELKKGGFEV